MQSRRESQEEPHSECVRCGRPTPAGVSLCEADNPGRIGAPSATQVHGTILIGVIVGFAIFALGARLVVGGGGPFSTTVASGSLTPDGGAQVVLRVANGGDSDSPASCRVTRDGVPRQEDYSFRTERIPGGGSLEIPQAFPAPGGGVAYDLDRITVACR